MKDYFKPIPPSGAKLLSIGDIVSAATSYQSRRYCGVYFLIEEDVVQYIGQSINAVSRIEQHYKSGKIFDSVAFLPCDKVDLDIIESRYIHMLNPPQQGRTRSGSCHAPMTQRRVTAFIQGAI